jgi:hypothetical protein
MEINKWIACSKCDFRQTFPLQDEYANFKYRISGSEIWFFVAAEYAWCPKCKKVRSVETLETSHIQSKLNELFLAQETYRLKHSGLLEQIKGQFGLSAGHDPQGDINNTNKLIDLMKARTDRKCLTCGYRVSNGAFESGCAHSDLSCLGGILTLHIEKNEDMNMSRDNPGRDRWYSAEGVFLGEEVWR